MTVEAKICGISTRDAAEAAIAGGADLIGLVFFSRSPRAVTPAQAGALAGLLPASIKKVGLLVDPEDQLIESILAEAELDLLQLHGDEAPARVAEIRRRFGVAVMKTLKITAGSDFAAVDAYLEVADRLMFDAKPPREMTDALPGGNALSFDWSLLAGRHWPLPWMLAGGLRTDNLAQAIRISGAKAVDVSSGVEDAPGQKNPQKIRAFLDLVKTL
jgi:phosphoribosylanthranilate isomerase